MKKYLKTLGFSLSLIILSCAEKEQCGYDFTEQVVINPPVSGCVENEFAGYMVTTIGKSGSSNIAYNEVAYIFNTTYNAIAPFGQDWNKLSLGVNQVRAINPAMWIESLLGNVFGIALDDNNGIYLSATDVFGYDGSGSVGYPRRFGSGGASGIYYTNFSTINTTTNLVTTLVSNNSNTVGTNQIPNSGIGLGNSIGNIAYDKVNRQLFATNLEDGRIYRINPQTGIVKSIFDPFVTDVPTNGLAPLGEQLWGIRVLISKGITSVYFARATGVGSGKEIWSIQLDLNGEFIASEVGSSKLFNDSASSSKQEIAIVGTNKIRCKITDIAFSSTGKMLLAERGYDGHRSEIFEFVKSGLTWTSGNKFYVGDQVSSGHPPGQNSTGGVDYGNRELINRNFKCDDIVWATGNFMKPVSNPPYIYGIQGMSSIGNSATLSINASNDLYLDPINTLNEKGGIGDVEIFDSKCPCNN